MKVKRILSALLALLMLSSALASCSSSSDNSGTSDTTAAADIAETTAAETEPVETDRSEIKDDLPALDFKGKSVNIYVATQAVYDNYVAGSEEKSGDVVNDAVVERNANVEDRLNIKLNPTPNADTYSTVAKSISTLILAGDTTYDYFMGHQIGVTQLVADKYFVNAYDVEHINFDQPWWNNKYMDSLTLGSNYRPILCGDFHTQATAYIRVNYFNKNLYNNIYGNPDELYGEVLDGTFTIERMKELVSGAYADINGNGVTDVDDRLGFICNQLLATVDSFVYGSDVQFTQYDKDGYIQLTMISDKAVTLLEKLNEFFYQPAVSTASGGKQNDIFKAGNALFVGNGLLNNSTDFRDMEDDYGFLPHPKFDENQDDYYSLVHDTALLGGIPITSQNIDIIGAVLEALNSESYRIVIPAWYENALKIKYARDDLSSQMIDLVTASMSTNFIFAYNASLSYLGTVYRTLLTNNSTDYVSGVQSILPAAEAELAKIIAAFKE